MDFGRFSLSSGVKCFNVSSTLDLVPAVFDKRLKLTVASAIALPLLSAAPGFAAIYTVSNTNDSGAGSLRQAVIDAEANAGVDTITFDAFLSGQTITLISQDPAIRTVPNGSCSAFSGAYVPSAALQITESVVVDGSSAPGLVIDGGWNGTVKSTQGLRIFYVPSSSLRPAGASTAGVNLALRDLTLTGGNAGILDGGSDSDDPCSNGGILHMDDPNGNLDLLRVTMSNGHANDGGAVKIERGSMTVSNSTFADNRARDDGGAIDIAAGPATLINSTISGNIAGVGQAGSNPGPRGGAIRLDGVMNLIYVTAAHNLSNGDGAFIENRGTLNVRNSLLVDNDSVVEGRNQHCRGTVNDLGGNWESVTNVGSTPSCSFNNGNNKDTEANIQLSATLADNGGQTQTLALDPSSSVNGVILTSDNLCPEGVGVADQRYFFRAVGAGCEPGAYELASGTIHSISGILYEEKGTNGVYDSGTDVPLPDGVTVNLYKSSDPATVVATALTEGGNGSFQFGGLPDGDYFVEVDTSDTDIPGELTLITSNPFLTTVSGSNQTDTDFEFRSPRPNVLLLKRITAINGDRTQNPNDSTDLSLVVNDGIADSPDDNANWPENYLLGAINAGSVKPNDEIEYTVYFLNGGDGEAADVRLCDLIQLNQTLVPDAYGVGGDVTLQLGAGTGSTSYLLTADDDAGDRTQLIATGDPVPSDRDCNLKATNTSDQSSGVLMLDITGASGTGSPELEALSGIISQGEPDNAFGFFRFTSRVNSTQP